MSNTDSQQILGNQWVSVFEVSDDTDLERSDVLASSMAVAKKNLVSETVGGRKYFRDGCQTKSPEPDSDSLDVPNTEWVRRNQFPKGTRLLFQQLSAPEGWTRVPDVPDSMVRVVSSSLKDFDLLGGEIEYPEVFMSEKVNIHGQVGQTSITEAQLASHTHKVNTTTWEGYASGWAGRFWGGNGAKTSTVTGLNEPHTHSLDGTAKLDMRIKYVASILCEKD